MARDNGDVMPQKSDKGLRMGESYTYDECIADAEAARRTQRRDTDPMIEKEGFLGIDELDRMRRKDWVRT